MVTGRGPRWEADWFSGPKTPKQQTLPMLASRARSVASTGGVAGRARWVSRCGLRGFAHEAELGLLDLRADLGKKGVKVHDA